MSNTDCSSESRAESVLGHPILKLKRFDGGLFGQLLNYPVTCSFGEIKVICEENGQELTFDVEGGGSANCICPINISFTIFNAMQDEYRLKIKGLKVGGVDLGTVSFKEHPVVEFDLETLERAYEEGFEYPVKVINFNAQERTYSPDKDMSKKFTITNYDINGSRLLDCWFWNYSLPCEYTYLDAQAEVVEDSTLVVNILTDGIPEQSCKRIAHLTFKIVNTIRDSYRLQLNHTILVKSVDGEERRCTVCLYEGNITLLSDDGQQISIPIKDEYDYSALIASMNP